MPFKDLRLFLQASSFLVGWEQLTSMTRVTRFFHLVIDVSIWSQGSTMSSAGIFFFLLYYYNKHDNFFIFLVHIPSFVNEAFWIGFSQMPLNIKHFIFLSFTLLCLMDHHFPFMKNVKQYFKCYFQVFRNWQTRYFLFDLQSFT